MLLGLIKLPVSLGVRVTKGAVELVWGLLHEQQAQPRPPAPARPEPVTTPRRAAPTPSPVREPEPAPPEPEHVDTGVEFVASFSEPAAADGAGAEVDVAEPWDGYAAMKAADVTKRLADASPEEAAAVELYEATHRKRRSVIAAAERRLKHA